MSIIIKYALLQIVSVIPFLAGYRISVKLSESEKIRRKVILFNLIFLEPAVVCYSIWGIEVDATAGIIFVCAFLLSSAGFVWGLFFSRLNRLSGNDSFAFILSSSMSNTGFTMGGFVCFLTAGEKALAYSYFCSLGLAVLIYFVIFPVCYSKARGGKYTFKLFIRGILKVNNMPAAGLAAGLILNKTAARPVIDFPLVDILMIILVSGYFASLGMVYSLKSANTAVMVHLSQAMIKFVLVPAAALIAIYLFSLNGYAAYIVFIESFMPCAVFSVVTMVLYGISPAFASRLFVWNTAVFLVLILPLLLYFSAKTAVFFGIR